MKIVLQNMNKMWYSPCKWRHIDHLYSHSYNDLTFILYHLVLTQVKRWTPSESEWVIKQVLSQDGHYKQHTPCSQWSQSTHHEKMAWRELVMCTSMTYFEDEDLTCTVYCLDWHVVLNTYVCSLELWLVKVCGTEYLHCNMCSILSWLKAERER